MKLLLLAGGYGVALITGIFSAALVLGQAKRAGSGQGGYDGGPAAYQHGVFLPVGNMAILVVFLAATFASIMGVACTPIAAAKASQYPGGFSGASKDLFLLEMNQATPADEKDDASNKPTEEEEESPYRDDE